MIVDKINYKLYKGDCLDELKNINDKSVNLVLIDPPYNIGKAKWDKWETVEDYVEFMGRVFLEIQRVLKDNGSFYFFHNDFLQIVELQNWINKNTEFKFKQLLVWNKRFNGASNKGFLDGFIEVEHLRNYQQMAEYCLFYTFQDNDLNIIKSTKDLFYNIKNYLRDEKRKSGLNLLQINQLFGINISDGIAKRYFGNSQWELPTEEKYKLMQKSGYWQKPYVELKNEYENLRKEYESLRYTFNNLKEHHSVMNYEIAKKHGHITPKNTDMLEYIIKTSSNEGDVVLDCFMGSGSTGVACLNTNRKFIGIELEDEYLDISRERLENIG